MKANKINITEDPFSQEEAEKIISKTTEIMPKFYKTVMDICDGDLNVATNCLSNTLANIFINFKEDYQTYDMFKEALFVSMDSVFEKYEKMKH